MNLDNLKEKYIPGTRIELSVMAGESQMPSGLKGTVTGVDDMGQVHINWDNGSSLALNVVEDSFKIIEKEERIKVLLIEPYKYSKVIEIGDDLDDMQATVGGPIEEYMPFDDDVAIVCNEEGKILGEDLNRAIYDNDGRILDIIAGKFFICYAPLESEKFLSLPDDMLKKYQEKFKYPERITLIDERIIVKPVKPLSKEMER